MDRLKKFRLLFLLLVFTIMYFQPYIVSAETIVCPYKNPNKEWQEGQWRIFAGFKDFCYPSGTYIGYSQLIDFTYTHVGKSQLYDLGAWTSCGPPDTHAYVINRVYGYFDTSQLVGRTITDAKIETNFRLRPETNGAGASSGSVSFYKANWGDVWYNDDRQWDSGETFLFSQDVSSTDWISVDGYNPTYTIEKNLIIAGEDFQILVKSNNEELAGEFDVLRPALYVTVADEELPKLFVVIPGVGFGTIPEHGEKMLMRAEQMYRYDYECVVDIPETPYLSDEEIRDMVITATQKAKEKGKDVIVNIDMDLDRFSLKEYVFWSGRWTDSVAWAGRIANIASEAFSEENPPGVRMLYAHSAGVDAASQSIQQMPGKMMYDDLNLFNGRTDAGILGKALGASGYGWWQVKVFTSKGDFPAIPLKTLSNYDAACRGAGKVWVHLHSLTFTGHNGLIENIAVPRRFKVNLGPYGRCDVVKTVEEMMLWDWQAGCPTL